MFANQTNSKAGKTAPADYGKASAFPFILQLPNPLNPREVQVQVHPGLTVRDYFACMALQADVGSPSSRDLAEWAYRVADAMIEARKEKEPAKPIGFPSVLD